MRFSKAVFIALVLMSLFMSAVHLSITRGSAGSVVVRQARDTPLVASASATPTGLISLPTDLISSPACRLKDLISTEFSWSHSFLGEASCSSPLALFDNLHLHPTVASVCTSSFGSSWKLLKHPLSIDWVATSAQESVVSSFFVPIAASCRDSAAAPGLVIDMGTNEGMFAMAAASLGCTVVTFDPQSLCIDIFKRALLGFKENECFGKRIYALNAAASAIPSTIEASIDSCHGCYMTDGSISCSGSNKTAGEWKRKKSIDSVNVQAVVHAIGYKEVLLLHIDTEGHEISVLRGLEAMLSSKAIKNLIIETRPAVWGSGDDKWIRTVLQLAGYKCWQLHNLYNQHLKPIHIDDPKPPIHLSLPIPECDMFCSVVHFSLDSFHLEKGILDYIYSFFQSKKAPIISCQDESL